MGELTKYQADGNVATITMDDGKVNVLSLAMLGEINAALDRAVADKAAVVLAGREGRFSGGFDLGVFRSGDPADGIKMLREGFTLAERLLSFPAPVVVACTGHAIAMGAFLLLSADYRIGTAGAFKIQANETAIGMALPTAAYVITHQRLTRNHSHRALALAEVYAPDERAIAAGWLDGVVGAHEVVAVAQAKAGRADGAEHGRACREQAKGARRDLAGAAGGDRCGVSGVGFRHEHGGCRGTHRPARPVVRRRRGLACWQCASCADGGLGLAGTGRQRTIRQIFEHAAVAKHAYAEHLFGAAKRRLWRCSRTARCGRRRMTPRR